MMPQIKFQCFFFKSWTVTYKNLSIFCGFSEGKTQSLVWGEAIHPQLIMQASQPGLLIFHTHGAKFCLGLLCNFQNGFKSFNLQSYHLHCTGLLLGWMNEHSFLKDHNSFSAHGLYIWESWDQCAWRLPSPPSHKGVIHCKRRGDKVAVCHRVQRCG